MLDPKLIRQDPAAAASRLAERGVTLDVSRFAALESERKRLQVETEALQAERNRSAKSIGIAKSRGKDIQPLLDQVAALGNTLDGAKRALTSESATAQAEGGSAAGGCAAPLLLIPGGL